jgi:hypothetical protein
MNHVAEHAGARLVLAPVAEGRQQEIFRAIAERHAIDPIDTAPLFTGPSFLPNDRHFTAQGARVMADLTTAYLEGFAARSSPSRPLIVDRTIGEVGDRRAPACQAISECYRRGNHRAIHDVTSWRRA